MLREIWTTKFKPKSWNEIVGNEKAREEFLNWLKNWSPEGKKAALIYGPAGVGKSLTVEIAAKMLGYNLIELNASDSRTKDVILEKVLPASRSRSISGKPNLVFLDEVDGIYQREDVGAVSAIKQLIDQATSPIVMVANDPWKQSLREIREKCLMIEFNRLRKDQVLKRLKKIVEEEGILIKDEALEAIAERSGGDMRSALTDLEALTTESEVISNGSVKSLLGNRLREESIFDAIRHAIYAKSINEAKAHLMSVDMNPDELLDWIYGNFLNIANDSTKAYEFLKRIADADFILATVQKKRSWSLIPYIYDLLAIALMESKKGGYIRLSRPNRVSEKWIRISKSQERAGKIKELKTKYHETTRTIIFETIPLMNFIAEKKKGSSRPRRK
ncbi:MAG: replication factor C large subunit [Thermoproteota archaeon]